MIFGRPIANALAVHKPKKVKVSKVIVTVVYIYILRCTRTIHYS